MDQVQVIPLAAQRELANPPRARNTAYISSYARDRRVHRVLVKVPVSQRWAGTDKTPPPYTVPFQQVSINLPQIDLLGNEGYTVMCERLALKFNEGIYGRDEDEEAVRYEPVPINADFLQPWVRVETIGMAEGCHVDRANFQPAFGQYSHKRDEQTSTDMSYADWCMRAIHSPTRDDVHLYEPSGPVQEYVVPHDRLQFSFWARVEHVWSYPDVDSDGIEDLAAAARPNFYDVHAWAEFVLAFTPNANKMYGP